jgi:hypothetical protein
VSGNGGRIVCMSYTSIVSHAVAPTCTLSTFQLADYCQSRLQGYQRVRSYRKFSVLPPMCRRGAWPGLPPPDALPEVPPPSRTPLSGYPTAAPAAGHPCPGALAAGHEASSAVVTPSRQYKRPTGSGPAADTAGPDVFLPFLARMNWPDGD